MRDLRRSRRKIKDGNDAGAFCARGRRPSLWHPLQVGCVRLEGGDPSEEAIQDVGHAARGDSLPHWVPLDVVAKVRPKVVAPQRLQLGGAGRVAEDGDGLGQQIEDVEGVALDVGRDAVPHHAHVGQALGGAVLAVPDGGEGGAAGHVLEALELGEEAEVVALDGGGGGEPLGGEELVLADGLHVVEHAVGEVGEVGAREVLEYDGVVGVETGEHAEALDQLSAGLEGVVDDEEEVVEAAKAVGVEVEACWAAEDLGGL